MFGDTAAVIPLPRLAVIGRITEVQEPVLSSKKVYHLLPFVLEAETPGGRGTKFNLLLEERWVTQGFDPASLLQEGETGVKKYGIYKRHVSNSDGTAHLQNLANSKYETIVAAFKQMPNLNLARASAVITKALTGHPVGYVLKQSTEDDRVTLRDQYEVAWFFPATKDGLERTIKTAARAKSKGDPIILTWEKTNEAAYVG
jgi:hypothetical protein